MALATVLTLMPFRPAAAGSVTVLAPVVEADGRLGLCDVLAGTPPAPGSQPWAQLAVSAGARINRWEFRWDALEKQRDVWDFGADDAVVQNDTKYGLSTLGILIGTPAWAAAKGQKPGNGLPKGLYLDVTDPRNLWADYVRQTVTHFRGQVQWWEIWNEPDLSYFWSGSPDDYFQLLKVAYVTLKRADPAARVIVAGMVVPGLAFLSQVLDDAQKDAATGANHAYFDAVAWHVYGPARSAYTAVGQMKDLLAQKGLPDVPIWVTEAGFPASNPNGQPRQAAYVLQTILYAFAAGANRVLVYRSSDDSTPKEWGLLDATGAPRMAYVSFQVAARYLAGRQAVVYDPARGVERFAVYEPGRRIFVLWSDGLSDRSLPVEADQPAAQLVDWQGGASPAQPQNDHYQVSLPGATYNAGVDPPGTVVGGPPRLLLQDEGTPAGDLAQDYLPPIQGLNRHLLLFNPSDAVAEVSVSARSDPVERSTVEIPAGSLRKVDLDLLAGPSYQGMYDVSQSGGIAAEGISDTELVWKAASATTWYLPGGAPSITLGNAGDTPVTATVLVFGPKGAVRGRHTVSLPPGQPVSWKLPSTSGGRRASIEIQAAAPVLAGAPAVAAGRDEWYALHPRGSSISLFNPDPHAAAEVDARYVGASAVNALQLRLAPRHSFVLPSHDAHAVALTATRAVVAAYADARAPAQTLLGAPSTEAAIPADGKTTGVVLFNPATATAHVTLSVVGGAATTRMTRALPPGHVYTVRVRRAGRPARGVSVSSDVPVVADPGP